MDKATYCVDADPRPTCVLDLASPDSYCHKNKALQERSHLLYDIRDPGASTGYRTWALDGAHSGTVTAAGGASLHAYTIDKRWRVIQ